MEAFTPSERVLPGRSKQKRSDPERALLFFPCQALSALKLRIERKVDNAVVSTRCSDPPKGCRVEVLGVIDEIRVVEGVNKRRL